MRKTHLWSGAAILAFAGLVAAAPAGAATHHRHHGMSTPAEREKTKQLNLQQLAMAQGQAPSNMTASVAAPNATPEVSTPMNNAVNGANNAVNGAVNGAGNAANSAVQSVTPSPQPQPQPQTPPSGY
jgi:hypothetical protein